MMNSNNHRTTNRNTHINKQQTTHCKQQINDKQQTKHQTANNEHTTYDGNEQLTNN